MQFALNRLDMRGPLEFAESAIEAEAQGWSMGLLPCNPLKVPDPYVCLAFAARATEHIHLGTLLDTPVIRHPSALAGSIATVAEFAPGRIHQGLGVGDTAVRFNGLAPAKVDAIESAVQMTRALLQGDAIDVGALKPARLNHAQHVPVWVAAQGPKNLRMAGRVADGVWIRVGRDPANLNMAWDAVKHGLADSGRAASDIQVGLIFHTAINSDAKAALLMAKAIAAGYYEYSKFLFDLPELAWHGEDPHTLRGRVYPDFLHHQDMVLAGTQVDFLPDRAADAFALYGDWEAIASQLETTLAASDIPAQWVLTHPVLPIDSKVNYLRDAARELLPLFAE
ncbi:MAG: LLM class flavin-dependent oxidoreductase [Pseudomonadales bacterium]|nr:LLM class flavin-dependent oxidoreductase [Pseudomonadales bacterium]